MTERSDTSHGVAQTVSASGVIELPVAEVFAFFAENHHRNHPRWDPDIEMELETEGPIGVGSVIRRHDTRYEEPVEGTMEITEFEERGPNETKITIETTVPEPIDPEMIQSAMQRSVQTIKNLAEPNAESQ